MRVAVARFHAPPLGNDVGADLVRQGLLVREPRAADADVILLGGAFRYTLAFWLHVGALVRSDSACGWSMAPTSPGNREAVRCRVVEEWRAAGAPETWAREEANAAMNSLVAFGPCASLGLGPSAG